MQFSYGDMLFLAQELSSLAKSSGQGKSSFWKEDLLGRLSSKNKWQLFPAAASSSTSQENGWKVKKLLLWQPKILFIKTLHLYLLIYEGTEKNIVIAQNDNIMRYTHLWDKQPQ